MNKHTLEKYPNIQSQPKVNKSIHWKEQHCLTKIKYSTERDAEKVMERLISKGRNLNVYQCTSCLKFHLTKRN